MDDLTNLPAPSLFAEDLQGEPKPREMKAGPLIIYDG